MRGEHPNWPFSKAWIWGSSPHARGARRVRLGNPRPGGIIPACAGSTRPHGRGPRVARDHPRMRGEHPVRLNKQQKRQGSSPHARGALVEHERQGPINGIIPACAGSTRPSPRRANSIKDHPRMRGEHATLRIIVLGLEGSSPHARGAPGCEVMAVGVGGIIPACAGSTGRECVRVDALRDHPRMRGEHCSRRWRRPTRTGSSPHARGALVRHLVSLGVAGIIPACAGSTPRHRHRPLP